MITNLPTRHFKQYHGRKHFSTAGVLCSYEALVDGLRQGPSSFADLVYHSQLAYEFRPVDDRPRAARSAYLLTLPNIDRF